MNVDKLGNLIKQKSKELGVSAQQMYDKYFFEQFLKRLSNSNYKDSFILKGGFLLENIVGVENRSTLDIDFSYQLSEISEHKLKEKIEYICNIDLLDQINYEIYSIERITNTNEYPGYRVKIKVKLANLVKIFGIDIATGDAVTPNPVLYNYKSELFDTNFPLYTYNIETIIAEKFQTLIEKGTANSRSKDLYDLYILINSPNLESDNLHNAIVSTFETRKTNLSKEYLSEIIETIIKSQVIKDRYESYRLRFNYSKDINFDLIIKAIKDVFSFIKYNDPIILTKPMSLCLIRHGSVNNKMTGGWSNTKLSAKGKSEVEILSDNLLDVIKNRDITIISSDLIRAVETSDIIRSKTNSKVFYNKSFRETNNGLLANISLEEFKSKYPNLYFDKLGYNEKYPNGESPFNFYERIKKAFMTLNEQYSHKSIILVTHENVISIIKSIANNITWSNKQKYSIRNSSYTLLEFK